MGFSFAAVLEIWTFKVEVFFKKMVKFPAFFALKALTLTQSSVLYNKNLSIQVTIQSYEFYDGVRV